MSENKQQRKTTLVVGGTGKTGRRVAKRLVEAGVPVTIGSRSAEPPFDWENDATWEAALRSVGSVYLTYYPDLAFPGAAERIASFADLAQRSGVQRLVLLSGRGEAGARRSEQAVRDYGAEWTILRSSWFAQNFSEHFLLEAVLAGVIALPAGEVAEPFVDADDIAAVAVAALTQDGHAGEVYELTGPRLLTFADVASELSQVTGRDVHYQSVTPDDYAAGAIRNGVPVEQAKFLTELFGEVLDGRNSYLTGDVQRVLGRPARDFAEYARATAANGVWDLPVGRRVAS